MKEKLTNERGQVGIGTLIVFIALVLVAAIAAGVLINTAGFLQTQAEDTGESSTAQVADNINIIGEVGTYDSSGNGALDEIRLTAQRAPGSSNIDLTGLSVQYVGDNGFAQLVHGGQLDEAAPGYYVQVITADTDQDAVITDDGDRYEIVIPLDTDLSTTDVSTDASGDDVSSIDTTDNVDDSLERLGEGERAEMEITTDTGATRNVVITAPDTFVGLDDDETVTL